MNAALHAAVRCLAPALLAALALACMAGPAHSEEAATPDWIDSLRVARAERAASADHALIRLVPEVSVEPFAIQPGPRAFRRRLWLSPGGGQLGSEPLYALRAGYQPSQVLGYELSFAHSEGKAVHAALYRVHALLRAPLPGRFQPYATLGYGMAMVFPGRSLNADPVTRNALSGGAGLELFLREDLALRGEWQRTSILGAEPERDRSVAYDYGEVLFGLTFHRPTGATP